MDYKESRWVCMVQFYTKKFDIVRKIGRNKNVESKTSAYKNNKQIKLQQQKKQR